MATLKLESFGTSPGSTSPALFASKMQTAVTTAAAGTVIDCTSYTGTITLATAITITRSVSLVFGNLTLVQGKLDQNLFNIFAPNVSITGVSRSTNSTANDGRTVFSMTISSVASYHIFCANTSTSSPSWASYSGLTLQNFDCIGIQSSYTASPSGNPVYTVNGAGGILIAEGNPGQANTNVQNVLISNVMVNNVGKHGIMIYGGMTSKLEKCRVSGAGGHGFYITGGSTSVNLDTCYASGTKLAGFCLHDTTYSTLINCASDSNGLGYWMRNANSITMSSCGAEANQVRTSIPNNLGITLPSQSGTITINDIGSDNVNFIKGTSYLFTGGSNITGTACYSKDPGNRAGLSTFLSKYTAHIHGVAGTTKVNMDNFKAAGTSTTKYLYRLEDVNNFHIDDLVTQYDPTNPTESPDGSMTFVNQILDQGANNIFGDFATSTSWLGRRVDIANSEDNLRINQLYVPGRLNIPVEPGHPVNPEPGTIYFNNTLNKLFMFSGTNWYDTCCATAPTPAPECVFPAGSITDVTPITNGSGLAGMKRLGNKIYILSGANNGALGVFDIATEQYTLLLNQNNLPRLAPDRSFVMNTGLAYNEANNCLYFAYGEVSGGEAGDPVEAYFGSAFHIVKYDITANTTLVRTTIKNDLASYENALTEWSRYQFYIYDGLLVGIGNRFSPYVINRTSLTIIRFDLETLDDAGNTVGVSMTSETGITQVGVVPDVSIDADFKYSFAEETGSILIKPSYYFVGEIPYLYLINLTNATFTKREFGTTVVPTLGGGTGDTTGLNIFTIAASEEGTYFLTNSLEGKLYEMEYTNFTPLLTRTIGNCAFPVERQVNGNRIIFYRKNTYSDITTSLITSFKCYNLTTDEFVDGAVSGVEYSGSQYEYLSVLSNSSYGVPVDGGPSYPFIYAFTQIGGGKIIKFCAPYTV
jgi:hypothetical protein